MIIYRLLLFLASIIWGTSFIVIKETLHYIAAPELILTRFIIATSILLILSYKHISRINHVFTKDSIILGVILSIAYIASTVGVGMTSASNATFLASLTIIFVPLLERLWFRHKLHKNTIAASIIVLVGVLLLTETVTLQINLGDILLILTALVMSFQFSITENVSKHMEIRPLLLGEFIIVTLVSGLFSLMDGAINLPSSPQALLPLLYLGIFPTLVTYMIITSAEKYIEDTEVAIILSFQGIFALVATVLLGLEVPSTMKLTGVLIMSIGFIVAEYHKRPRPASKVRQH